MAWIQSHQTLARHRKLILFARALGISHPTAIGHLHLLWWWALDNAPTGNLTELCAEDLAYVTEWNGDPSALCSALWSAGFIEHDENENTVLHDWDDYAGRLVDKRTADADRKRIKRAKEKESQEMSAGCPTDVAPTSGRKSRVEQSREEYIIPPTPQGGETDIPSGKSKAPRNAELPAWFSEVWEANPKKVNKQGAEKAAKKLAKGAAPDLAEHIKFSWSRFVADYKAKNGTDYTFLPHLATWLNAGRWTDHEMPGNLVAFQPKDAKVWEPFLRERRTFSLDDQGWAEMQAKRLNHHIGTTLVPRDIRLLCQAEGLDRACEVMWEAMKQAEAARVG